MSTTIEARESFRPAKTLTAPAWNGLRALVMLSGLLKVGGRPGGRAKDQREADQREERDSGVEAARTSHGDLPPMLALRLCSRRAAARVGPDVAQPGAWGSRDSRARLVPSPLPSRRRALD